MDKTEVLTGKEQRKVLFRLLSYAKPHMKIIAIAFFLLLLTTLGDIIGPILVKIFIDDYLTPRNIVFKPLFTLGAAFMAIQIANVLVSYFQLLKFQEIALKIIQQLRIDVFSKVQTLGLKYFDKTPAGAIVSRVTNDTEAIKEMFVSVLVTFIQSGFLLIGIFIAMFSLNVKLALVCTILFPIIFMIISIYRKYSSVFYQEMREQLSRLNAKLNESIQGMGIIQLFRQEKRLRKEFGEINEKHYKAGMRNIKLDGLLLRPAIDLVYVFAIVMILSYFGITSFNSPVEIGVLYAFVNYIDRFFEPINQMMMRLSMYQQAIVSASRVFRLIDETELAPEQGKENHHISEGKIEFRNVSFSYDGKRDVLKNISFIAQPGETVALVGHTGSGKSSIINLLMRFYEFERGNIYIDGISLKDYPIHELRKKMGLVLQDPFLFYGTIKDNIRLYNEEISDEEVIAAAKFVQAYPFIELLDKRFDHQVVERGSTFSSGQRQLIAFARTIAANPKILVLDEATANIDTETEEAIQIALNKMRKGRTTIAIAHRLSTIQDADLILVLHQGEIVERGTHQELLAMKGLYHKMYLLQNESVERINHVVS
ncbi:ATP-binding cassette domain-containing protein [Bacillus aquiflavi]|uniref:ATP-binding cassette domain-containing protein n=1 Tax=Bacillus aquiflavi TaxID=2672567 RepID=A0A6B3W1S8_9BACI|nr:ABC transporter transmembrane domain-containing protein [Bacillus aquiflavi]MBA4537237.1 ATP-binding cassette domain-containing protein [Bacillus aquiflavi]NEY81494.1 ATP-binding cassette domain-containing protein [Bacillus aquiflavi]UAC49498.1 ATP-binding cassette domain-containing protein [Bacillus aquiflavi]